MRSQPYTKNCKQLRTSGSRRNTLSKGRVHQLLVQCQMTSSKTKHTNDTTQIEQVTFRNMYLYVYKYIQEITISEKKRPELERQ